MTVSDEIPKSSSLLPGTKLSHGLFTIERRLAAGGFGITYLAKDSLDRVVIIKECYPNQAVRRTSTSLVQALDKENEALFDQLKSRFVDEAKRLSTVNHPNVVKVHAVFEERGTAYMVMDFIDGPDLDDIIRQNPDNLTPDVVYGIAMQLLSAVEAAHDADVLHRDIKPSNIIMDSQTGQIFLIDFGAARGEMSSNSRKMSSLLIFSDEYAPEEFYTRGLPQREDSDLYSVAATLYHLITRQVPLPSSTRHQVVGNGGADPVPGLKDRVTGYTDEFLQCIEDAMSLDRSARPLTARQWMDRATKVEVPDTEAPAAPNPVSTGPTRLANEAPSKPSVAETPSRVSRRPALALLGVACALAVGGFAMFPNALSKVIGSSASIPFAEAMLASSAVQSCDEFASHPLHPAVLSGVVKSSGVDQADINAADAIPACLAALEEFPDHPRLLTFFGRALNKDEQFDAARDAFQKAYDLGGDALAAFELGEYHELGQNGQPSDSEALTWYRRSADRGFRLAQRQMGIFRRDGRGGLKPSDESALDWFQKAADQGDDWSEDEVGIFYRDGRGGLEQSDEAALAWFQKAADQGFDHSELWLGIFHFEGRGGLEVSDDAALFWFQKAADKGNADAEGWVGLFHQDGRGGLTQSDETALIWYLRAADGGDSFSVRSVGIFHRDGRGGLKKSDRTALRWFQRAADAGDAWSQDEVAIFYREGRGGLAQSDENALLWFQRAADQGFSHSERWLGIFHRDGRGGLEASDENARIWFERAAAQGDERAQELADALGPR